MWLLPIGIAVTALLFFVHGASGTSVRTFSYTGFVSEATTNMVSTATITSAGSVSGKLRGGSAYTSQIPTALNNSSLSALLLSHKVAVTGTSVSTTSLLDVLLEFLPFLFIIAVFIWIGRASRKQLGGLGGSWA